MITTLDGRLVTEEQLNEENESYLRDEIQKTLDKTLTYLNCELEELYVAPSKKDPSKLKIQISLTSL